jgi:asparagine synthetase B (glutamine-hydrolysing)
MAPARAWRLVLVDVSVGALSAARPRIEALIAPAETVMDLNIGAALFFGARGVGRLCDPPRGAELRGVEATAAEAADGVALTGGTALSARAALCRYAADAGADAAAAELAAADAGANAGADADAGAGAGHGQPYECTARVLLLGTGADEQLAGYGRHRTAFAARGAEALKFELLRDVTRLWVRNLGRDDRAMADAGREPRHPFLDERVLEVVARCAAGTLFDLSLPVVRTTRRARRDAAQRASP